MVSVIVPIFNAEKNLPVLIDCLRRQKEKNFEVLLIDDGSSDDSGRICEEIVQKDQRFKCFHQKNLGVSEARNKGLEIANGKYITFLDADDAIDENYLEVLVQSIEKYDADVMICNVIVRDEVKELKKFVCSDAVWNRVEALNYLLERKKINSGPYAKLYRKDILKGVKFPKLKAYEDILFVKDVFCKCEKIAVTDKTSYYYIQNEIGTMSNFIRMPSEDIIVATDILLKFIVDYKILNSDCFYTTASHLMQYVQPLLEKKDEASCFFVKKSKMLFRKYLANIIWCNSFPWKEKIAYCIFGLGWDLWHKKRI